MSTKLSVLAKELKPYILPWIQAGSAIAAGAGAGDMIAHDLAGPYHTGTLDRSQAPWVATDISSALATHVAAADPHPAYVLASGDTMTGPLLLPNGSAAAPALAFSSDADTGLIRSASNKLGLVTGGTEWATLDGAGTLAVSETLTAGWVRNSVIGIGGQGTNDLSMLGFYDRNELTNSDLRGTVTVTITGAGTVTTSSINNAFNARGGYLTITGTDATTTQIVIQVDMGATVSNYGSTFWQPFLQYRLSWSNTSGSKYRNIVVEVSSNGTTWLKPATGWETTDASTAEIVNGLWLGTNGQPGVTWRYARFTLTDRVAGATSADQVWISQIGLRHYAAPYTRAWLHASGDTAYGPMVVRTSNAAALDVKSSAGTSLFTVNTSAALVTVEGDLDVSDTLTALNGAIGTTYDSTATLKVQSVFDDDITLFLKQKAGQTARIWRVEDSAGQELIVLDSQGNWQSGNPGFASGLTGWQMTPIGNLEANNVWIRGELHASIFVMDEFHASGGTLYVSPAGKLELDATVYTTTGIEAVFDIRTTSVSGSGSQLDIRTTSASGSGSQLTFRTIENYLAITDPPSGHAMILQPGDRIRCKALGLGVGIDLWDVWGVVSRVEDMTDYYRYYYERKSGGTNGLVIPAGTAIISYGPPGAGRIYLTADQNYAPYMQVFLSGEEPWNGQITPTVRVGRLDGVGLPGVSGIEQHGIVLSSDLSNAAGPYLVASNLQMFSYKIDSEWNNGNPTARITADGAMKLGTDIDNAATTGFDFNPLTGALTIGSAAYSGSVTVYGNITVTGGNAAKVDFSNITATLDSVPNGSTYFRTTANQVTGAGRAFTALNGSNSLVTSVIPATAVTPGGAGLFLGSNYMGYHNGTDWKTYTDSSGNWKLLGNASNNYIQWAAASNKLQGVGGGVEQWYADATDGKFYAAGGSLGMDNTGLWLKMNTASSWATANAIAFRNASNLSLVVAALLTRTVTSSQYLSLVIDPNGTPVGIEIIASPAATRTNITHDLTVQGTTTLNNDLDMNGYDILNANVLGIRTTAP